MYNKITVGYVTQKYNDEGVCIGQEFIASDEVEYENDFGEEVDTPDNEVYQPFHMVQPTNEGE